MLDLIRRLFGVPAVTAAPAADDYIVRFEAPICDGSRHRYNLHQRSRADAVRLAADMRRKYALGDASSYPIAIIGVRWKGVAARRSLQERGGGQG